MPYIYIKTRLKIMGILSLVYVITLISTIISCDFTGPAGPPGAEGGTDTVSVVIRDTVYIAHEDGREIVWLTPADVLGEADGIRYFDISYPEFKVRRSSPILAQLYWANEKWAWVEWIAITCDDQQSIYYQKLGIAETGRFRMAYFFWDVIEE